MTTGRLSRALTAAALLLILHAPAQAQETSQEQLAHEIAQLNWFDGPNTIEIANVAGFDIPAGYEMLTPPDSLKFIELNGNAPTADDAGDYILQNDDINSTWFAILSYEPSGHVDDSQPIDPNQLLATTQQASDLDNENRQKQGIPTMTLNGWAVTPTYDPTTHRLEWAFNFTNQDGTKTINLNALILGRTGELRAIIVDDPNSLVKDLPDINTAMNGFSFNFGQRYEDTQPADPKSPYTMATLIGGAPTPPPTPPPKPNHLTPLLKALTALAILTAGTVIGLRALAGRR